MPEKNKTDKFTGILFELKIGLNKENALVIDYGGKPVAKIREALKMDRLERYASKISNWFWLKRWGDRSLYQRSQKKRHSD